MKKILLPVLLLLTYSCKVQQPVTTDRKSESIVIQSKIYTAFYQQKAAEYNALCLQSYSLAKTALDEALSKSPANPAIISDIDETILDNSAYAVKRALEGKEYTLETWQDWTSKSLADTLAGALAFFRYAKEKGVEVFYITNREESEREGTARNLQKYGFPEPDQNHLLLKAGTSSKEARRQSVAANHTILLLLGDNLADFSADFDKKQMMERQANTMKAASQFGSRYIILPNPFYGDWEGSAFKYNYSLTPQQKDSVIKSLVKSY